MADAKWTRMGMPVPYSSGSLSYLGFALNGTTDQLEVIFQAPEAITITRLGYRVESVTGSIPANAYKISLQGVGTTGNPDGTIKGGGTPASATITPSGSNSWVWVNLDNSYTCTRGEFLAWVIAYNTGTINGSNFATITYIMVPTQYFPYAITNNAGSRSRATNMPVFGYGSVSKAYGHPSENTTTEVFDSTTNPDELAVKFTLPAAWGDTYQVVGVRAALGLTASGSVKMILYTGTDATAANSTGATTETTVAQEVTIDQDYAPATTSAIHEWYFDEATLTTLYYGGVYRIGFQPQGAQSVALNWLDVDAAGDWDAHPGGQNFSASTRVNAGNWTDSAVRRFLVEIILADITEPSVVAPLVSRRRKVR